MQQVNPRGFQGKENKFNPDRYPLVEVALVLHAPVEKVWRAWSDPEIVKQWWGPEGFTCPEAKMDFRVGGRCTLAMQDPKGKINWSSGEYLELVPNEKLVCTDYFSDEYGEPVNPSVYGMTGNWPANSYISIEFERVGDNQTKMSVKHEGIPHEMHDDCVQGWTSSLRKLQRTVQAN